MCSTLCWRYFSYICLGYYVTKFAICLWEWIKLSWHVDKQQKVLLHAYRIKILKNLCKHLHMWRPSDNTEYKELRYIGIFIVSSRIFRCSLEYAKRPFYRAANAIFGKIGRIASEDILVQLLKLKCMPILLHAVEVCQLPIDETCNHWTSRSTDFVWNFFEQVIFLLSSTIKKCLILNITLQVRTT